jgi:hypothetical protein
MEVTGADVAAFRATADRGQGSAVVRALRATWPAAAPPGQLAASPARPAAAPPGQPAWAAWAVAAAAATATVGGSVTANRRADDKNAGAIGGTRLTWLAVFAAGTVIADTTPADPAGSSGPVTVPAAIAAGLETAAIVESGLDEWGGWSSGTVAAVIGAGVTAGLLLGLNGPQLRAAIGICATQASGLRAAEGTDAFPLQVGKAAFNGVEAALLARGGFTAPAEPLDGRRGLFALFGV